MEQIAPGINRWTAPHPTWRTSVEAVASYALVDGDVLIVIDPQLPTANDVRRAPLLAHLHEMTAAAARLELLITMPNHARSVESLYERYWDRLPTNIWGHPGVKLRLTRHAPLQQIILSPGSAAVEIADGNALAFAIGKPRRSETPLYFPRLRTVAFGDSVVGTQGGLRFWNQSSSAGAQWYRDVFAPTLAPLLEHDIDHVLVAHGPCVIGDGRRALEECLAADPVSMY
jgi:hypothetical protein